MMMMIIIYRQRRCPCCNSMLIALKKQQKKTHQWQKVDQGLLLQYTEPHSHTDTKSLPLSYNPTTHTQPHTTNQCPAVTHGQSVHTASCYKSVSSTTRPYNTTETTCVHTASHYKPVSLTTCLDNTAGTTCMQSHRACSHSLTLQISVLYNMSLQQSRNNLHAVTQSVFTWPHTANQCPLQPALTTPQE